MASLQQQIIQQLRVQPTIDPQQTIDRIVAFLASYVVEAGARGYVLGVSGGQDSTLVGALAQRAVARVRRDGGVCELWALRLPYGQQADEHDAELAMRFIAPDRAMTINIRDAVDTAAAAVGQALGSELTDYHRGNVKARVRMVLQYAVAGQQGLLVLGTGHAAESVTGFSTKFGDAACDVAPLEGLTKRQGRLLLQTLQAPERLYTKVPTADLENERPMLADEEALGVSYDLIDDYLEGKVVNDRARQRIEKLYMASRHKRDGAAVMPR